MAQAPIKTIIALDVGLRRIGVAKASMVAKLASPYGAIQNDSNVLTSLGGLIKTEHAITLVIGLPRGLNGQETAQTQQVRDFTDRLKAVFDIPIHFQDEAVTSKQAEAELRGRGVRYNKEAVDALAATYILND